MEIAATGGEDRQVSQAGRLVDASRRQLFPDGVRPAVEILGGREVSPQACDGAQGAEIPGGLQALLGMHCQSPVVTLLGTGPEIAPLERLTPLPQELRGRSSGWLQPPDG